MAEDASPPTPPSDADLASNDAASKPSNGRHAHADSADADAEHPSCQCVGAYGEPVGSSSSSSVSGSSTSLAADTQLLRLETLSDRHARVQLPSCVLARRTCVCPRHVQSAHLQRYHQADRLSNDMINSTLPSAVHVSTAR